MGNSAPRWRARALTRIGPNRRLYFSWQSPGGPRYPRRLSWEYARKFCMDHCMDLVAVDEKYVQSALERCMARGENFEVLRSKSLLRIK